MRGEEQARYVTFVEQTSPRLLAAAWLLTGDRHRAEDLVQESLLRVFLTWRKVRSETAGAYARTVLMNLHAEQWRRHGKREDLYAEPADLREAAQSGQVDSATVDLVRALRSLPPRERQAVVLRHYLDLSEKDTATAMECSIGSVKSATSRGLARLKENLAGTGASDAPRAGSRGDSQTAEGAAHVRR